MFEIMKRSEDLRATLCHKRKLEEIQEKALAHPENIFFQVRIGNFLAKLKKKAEAIAVYEQTVQKFIQKNLFVHAAALKRTIFRLKPARDDAEQTLVLLRLHAQMMECREKALIVGQQSSLEKVCLSQELVRRKDL